MTESLVLKNKISRLEEINRSLKRLEEVNDVLFKISNAVNTTYNLDELYASIHMSLSRIIDVTNFYISKYDEKKDCIYFPFYIDTLGDGYPEINNISKAKSSLTGLVLKKKKPLLLKYQDICDIIKKSGEEGYGTISKVWMGVPLKHRDRVIGVIVVQSYDDENKYTEKDVDILVSVSDQVAIAIDRKRAEEELVYNELKIRTLFKIANAVNTASDLKDLYKSIHKALSDVLDVTNFYIATCNKEKDSLTIQYFVDTRDSECSDEIRNISKKLTLSGEIIKKGDTLVIYREDIYRWKEHKNSDIRGTIPEVCIGVPLKIKDKVIGGVVVQSYTDREKFGLKDIEILETVSDQIAIAIDKKHAEVALKEALAKIERTNSELQNEIIVRKKAEKNLKIAKNTAEASDNLKSEFLANMSHEIRTPMNAILGFTDIVLKTKLNEKQCDYLQKIKHSASSLLYIIDDILDFSKIEAGKLSIEQIDFKLDDILSCVSDLFTVKAAEKGINISFTSKTDVPANLVGDPVRLRQILINLIGNAVKFTEKGEISVEVSLKEKKDDRVKLMFTVSDTGIGIPDNRINSLFDSFVQVDGSTTRNYGGTGLGLSISRQLVELMDGSISVESEVGKGSNFNFHVTLKEGRDIMNSKEKEKETDSNPLNPASYPDIAVRGKILASLSVLLVEDNPLNQEIASEILKSLHIHVDIANNGLEAVGALRQKKYNVVLMDIQMPELDGYGATYKIRNELKLKNLPIIAMTAHAMPKDREKCLNAGMDDYITKPVNPNILFSKLIKWGKSRATPSANVEISKEIIYYDDKDLTEKNFPGLDVAGGVARLMGNIDTYIKLLDGFSRNFKYAVEKIRYLQSEPAISELLNYIHTMKGVAGNISAPELHDILLNLESGFKEKTSATDELMKDFHHELKRVMHSISLIKNIRKSSREPQKDDCQSDVKECKKIISLIREKIVQSDIDAIELFPQLKKNIVETKYEKQLLQLEEHIDNVDFENAEKLLSKLSDALSSQGPEF